MGALEDAVPAGSRAWAAEALTEVNPSIVFHSQIEVIHSHQSISQHFSVWQKH